jgi:hypothetical protein
MEEVTPSLFAVAFLGMLLIGVTAFGLSHLYDRGRRPRKWILATVGGVVTFAGLLPAYAMVILFFPALIITAVQAAVGAMLFTAIPGSRDRFAKIWGRRKG